MTKEQFIKHCIDNKCTVSEIQNYLEELNNPEFDKILAKNFINFNIDGYFELDDYGNANKYEYREMLRTTNPIKNYTNNDYHGIRITQFISWYVKNIKFK